MLGLVVVLPQLQGCRGCSERGGALQCSAAAGGSSSRQLLLGRLLLRLRVLLCGML